MLFQGGGWQLCPKEYLIETLGFKEQDIAPNGLLIRGDIVLSRMPMDLWKEKEQDKIKKAKAPMQRIEKFLKKGDPSLAGTGHPSMKGLQPAKDLRMSS